MPHEPVEAIVPPVSGVPQVTEVTVPTFSGPMVVPLTRTKVPAVVVQTSPFTGLVGAVPCGRFSEALAVVAARSCRAVAAGSCWGWPVAAS
jgi:hypothetical protein